MIFIYNVCYNTPEFIEPQFKLLQKFIKNDFKYIIFNNTNTDKVITQENTKNNILLKEICSKLKIDNYDVPKKLFETLFHLPENVTFSLRAGRALDFCSNFLVVYPMDKNRFLPVLFGLKKELIT